ncbi:hypothetical protein PAXINDRAFT_20206 [Paxillus involutus ATCC 200175]|uniref:Uncharacterized protein n=1 Tax=Paxillus involutus ATCC 200175 TaxID=664439 RepID=A0A0C9SMQ9_PAXIN|nr:hypothetical protein PAXINDRAFT_20206 [Paxillus involutus ATCC 200175]
MAFSLMRPPSPSRDAHPSHISPGHEDDHPASALHAVLSTLLLGSSSHSDYYHDTNKERAGQAPSGPESRPLCGHGSRVPCPERHLTVSSMTMSPISGPNEPSVRDGYASQSLPGLFSMQMQPLTFLTSSA